MSATTLERNTNFAGVVPSKGTMAVAANKLILKGTIVAVDSDGRADPAGAGLAAVGKASSTVDNRTTAPSGGGAGAESVEVEYGVFGWAFTGTTPEPGQVVFVVDNQTVNTDSNGGTRGIAGYVSEVRGSTCYVLMGPTVAGQIVIAAAEAADLDQAQADIIAAEADIDALEANALTAQYVIPVPLGSFRVYSTGGAAVPWDDGVDDGIDPTAESAGYRFNVGSTAKIAASVLMPNDVNDAANVVVHVLGYRVGSADATAALTIAAFFRVAGAAFNADADAGGDTSAFDGASNAVTEETLTIANANVPASPSSLLLTLVPTAALDADDLVILEVWLECTRKLLTS